MKPENLKKLLHQNRHKPSKNHFKEDQLNIRYIKINDLKTTNKASAFNIERNKVIDEQLNKYMHPNSVHIRLKPYFDSGTWIKWIGVLGDVTLPNKTNLNGSLLIDKISCYSDKVEILDYHAWLNIENIKYIEHHNQQLAIGDYIEGISQVKQYGQGKYGLAATYIKKAGMFIGTNKAETLVSTYDRQDSWVVELNNNNLTKKNYTENFLNKDLNEFASTGAHVDAKFQPSRYEKFQQRLQKLQQGESDDVLPLVDKSKKKYTATVVRSHAVKIPNIAHKMPQLEVKDVKVADSGRLVFARYSLPYVSDIKKLGELQTDDQISFFSEAAPSSSNSFNMVTNFELLTEHDFIPLPSNPNAFLGYIMWRHPEEGESTYIANYQNWALANQIHTEEINHEIDSIRPTSNLTELELANNLNIDQKLVGNARKQGLVNPVTSNGLTRRYDSDAWNLLRQVIGAQDSTTIEQLKQIYPIYTTDDIVKKTGVDRRNGLHCSINIYGPKVFDLFKTRKTVQDLLPNKTGVVTKREIPVNKSLHEVIEKAEAEDKEKQVQKQETTPKTEPEVTEQKKPVIKFIKRAEPKTQPTEPQPKVEEPIPATANSTIIISTFADEKFDYATDDAKKAIADIMAAAEKTMVNKMLPVKDHTTGQPAIISVKAIMKMELQ
ncbi:molybdenum ABC transporter ATP-binding protein [Lactobacillus kitasatonis]|uniref:molybdenum ABC transporter ATP-binding protein n=1 Tax=Lactobacillus kitasatonis TaxID=237446 RepID=UPI0026E9D88E|nr:molybdenum ABC transporter ATP-binding protein [Lactobacillus kitasatonis]